MAVTKKCAIIVRVSSPGQAVTEKNTIDIQEAEILKYIEAKNFDKDVKYEKFKVFKMVGVSGSKSFNSSQFDELQLDIARGDVQVVICTALDRLGRDVSGFLDFWEYLRSYNVQLIITRMSLDTSTPVGEMLLVVLMALAKLELDIKSERNRENTLSRAKDGLYNGSRPVLGYDLNPDPLIAGRLVVNEKEAEIVRMAFRKYLELGSDAKLARYLMSLGHRNKRWRNRDTNKWMGGGDITSNVVRTMLKNPVYIAIRRYKEKDNETGQKVSKEQPGCWEPIIDIDLFKSVQEARRKAIGKRGYTPKVAEEGKETHSSLLIEVVHCRYCGLKMSTTGGYGKKKLYHYYTCTNGSCPYLEQKERKPAKNSVNSDELDNVALEALRKLLTSESNMNDFMKMLNERVRERQPELQGQLKKLSSVIARLEEEKRRMIITLGGLEKDSSVHAETEIEIEKSMALIKEYMKTRGRVTAELETIRRRTLKPGDVRKMLQNMKEVMKKGTKEQRRGVVRMLFRSVTVDPEQAEFNLFSDSVMYHQFVNRKRGVLVAGDMAPRFSIKTNPLISSIFILCPIPSAHRKVKPRRTFRNPIFVALELKEEMLRDGISQAELARRHGISRARVHQWLSLLELPKREIERLKAMGDNWEKRLLTERILRKRNQAK